MKFAHHKTEVMYFGNTKWCRANSTVNFSGTALQPVPKLRYLGIFLDSKLQWTHHVEEIVQKANYRLSYLSKICRMFWGVTRTTMCNFYIHAVRHVMDYASLSWANITPGRFKNAERSAMSCAADDYRRNVLNILCAAWCWVGTQPFGMHFRRKASTETLRLRAVGPVNIANPGCQLKRASASEPIFHPYSEHSDGLPLLFGTKIFSCGTCQSQHPRGKSVWSVKWLRLLAARQLLVSHQLKLHGFSLMDQDLVTIGLRSCVSGLSG